MEKSHDRPFIQWAQVSGLALLQGAISLMWVIYNLYLPELLSQFGLDKSVGVTVAVIENLLMVGLEPLMGALSDRMRYWFGSRFLLIAIGVVTASALFVAIPAIGVFGNAQAALDWVLVGALIAWALAMTMFRSPAMALLGGYAIATQLPQAVSLLNLMAAVAGAVGLFASQFILSLGPAIAFTIGSLVLLTVTAVLRSLQPPSAPPLTAASPIRDSIAQLGWVFGVGVGLALSVMAMRAWLTTVTPQPPIGLLGLFSLAHILTVVPAGKWTERLGIHRAMLLGIGGVAIGLLLLSLTASTPLAWAIVVLLGTAFSLIANGTLPLAFVSVPPSRAGLGVGMYFGGAALAGSAFPALAVQLQPIAPSVHLTISLIGLLVAGFCITQSRTNPKSSPA